MKTPMVLQNIRIHGLGEVINGPWIKVSSTITYFHLTDDFSKRGFLRTIQSINPPNSLKEDRVFQDYPTIIRQGKYQKLVRPEKRTVAFAIFIAQPDFVRELAEVTYHLYEADRIEVGRRLDYSRWVNFVEIASSTRWSEVDERIIQLAEEYPDSLNDHQEKELASIEKTDRITGELMESLSAWLQRLKSNFSQEQTEMIENLLFDVNRQKDFKRAKKLVRKRLPYFYLVARDYNIENWADLLTSENKQGNPPPILLVDEQELKLSSREKQKWRQHAADLSQSCQILYLLEGDMSDLPANSHVVTSADLAK